MSTYKINDIVWIKGVLNPGRICKVTSKKALPCLYEVEFTHKDETIIDDFLEEELTPYIARQELVLLAKNLSAKKYKSNNYKTNNYSYHY